MSKTTVQVLAYQNGSSNKIWAQVGRFTASAGGKGKHMVIHGPIRKNGAGLVENQSSATWRDKESKGYHQTVVFSGVPEGMEKVCVAAVAHVIAGHSPSVFMGASAAETEFAKVAGEAYQRSMGMTVNMELEMADPVPDSGPAPAPQPTRQSSSEDLAKLLKSNRTSGFF